MPTTIMLDLKGIHIHIYHIQAFRNTLNYLLETYPNNDREIFADKETSDNYGPVYLSAIRLRIR
jgi:hypothetical protein